MKNCFIYGSIISTTRQIPDIIINRHQAFKTVCFELVEHLVGSIFLFTKPCWRNFWRSRKFIDACLTYSMGTLCLLQVARLSPTWSLKSLKMKPLSVSGRLLTMLFISLRSYSVTFSHSCINAMMIIVGNFVSQSGNCYFIPWSKLSVFLKVLY